MKLLLFILCIGLQAGDRVLEISAYCPCRICCGKWAGGPTASGVMPKQGVTVACNWLPFGTRVQVEGLGERIVQDRMSKRFSHRMDIYFRSHDEAKRWGVRKLKVEVKR